MIFRNTLCLIFLILTYIIIHGMEQNTNYVIYALPGQNGSGSESDYIKEALDWDGDIIQVKTPYWMTDLGQFFCQRYLNEALTNESRNVILYTTSQGTATGLNYLAYGSHSSKVKAIICEATLASGNSAIYHTVSGSLMNKHWISNIPGSYYVAPYVGAVACPGYRPGGQQPIWSIDIIKKDIPIIIVHSNNDMQLPFYGACALYYRLRANGNENVYFLEKDGYDHIQLLDDRLAPIVRTILKRHLQQVPNARLYTNHELAQYQPKKNDLYKQYYTYLIRKESRLWYFEHGALLAAMLYFGLKL